VHAVTPTPRYVDASDPSTLTFSICSLVADQAKYDRLLASFGRLGFTPENSEFLAADNRDSNRFDGYSWRKTLLAHARGRYVVFCHDDIELLSDGYDALLQRIAELDALDPAWLLAGVAGGAYRPADVGRWNNVLHISDKFGADRRRGTLPARAESLDECFMLMRRCRPVVSSYDLGGFHHYGPDLCLQAECAGGSSYVFDFHIFHHGSGRTGPPFRKSRRAFIRKYMTLFPGRVLHCTTGQLDLGAANPARPSATEDTVEGGV
jgi:hypothetical protein